MSGVKEREVYKVGPNVCALCDHFKEEHNQQVGYCEGCGVKPRAQHDFRPKEYEPLETMTPVEDYLQKGI